MKRHHDCTQKTLAQLLRRIEIATECEAALPPKWILVEQKKIHINFLLGKSLLSVPVSTAQHYLIKTMLRSAIRKIRSHRDREWFMASSSTK